MMFRLGLPALTLLAALWGGASAAQTPLDPALREIAEMQSYRRVCGWFKETPLSDQDVDRALRMTAQSKGIDVDDRKTRGTLRQMAKAVAADYSGRLAGDQFRWCETLSKKILALAQKDT
jgi:hypothetical protein